MSRQPSPLDVHDHDSLIRIAKLAASVMGALRTPGRGLYTSERELRGYLANDGVPMTTSDLMPALTLLEATNRIQRPEVKQNTPRPGRLAKGADVWHSMNGAVPTVDVAEDTPDDVPEAAEDEAVDAH